MQRVDFCNADATIVIRGGSNTAHAVRRSPAAGQGVKMGLRDGSAAGAGSPHLNSINHC